MRKPRKPKQERGSNDASSGGLPPDPPDPPLIKGPGSKTRRGERPLDEVRTLILERIRERRLSIADISRALNRNDAYMHQFIWRCSPMWLGENDRAVICHLLEIPEEVLKKPAPGGVAMPKGYMPLPTADASRARDVPLYKEGASIEVASPLDWTFRLPGYGPGALVAIWISAPHQHFGPGDTIYVHHHMPPRVGDQVVVVQAGHVSVIGKLTHLDDAESGVDDGRGTIRRLKRTEYRLQKVVGVLFA